MPGRTVSVGRGGSVGSTGALPELKPTPGRVAGFPGRPKSSFVSMIGFTSSNSGFLRPNMFRHLLTWSGAVRDEDRLFLSQCLRQKSDFIGSPAVELRSP